VVAIAPVAVFSACVVPVVAELMVPDPVRLFAFVAFTAFVAFVAVLAVSALPAKKVIAGRTFVLSENNSEVLAAGTVTPKPAGIVFPRIVEQYTVTA
jgi:hypothetical protein